MSFAHPAVTARRQSHAAPTVGETVWLDGDPMTILAVVDGLMLLRDEQGSPAACRADDGAVDWAKPRDRDAWEIIAEMGARIAARAAEDAGEMPPVTYQFPAG